ncbi:Hypothetical protein AA314_08361 [Archangium gephyra]|uniref:Uncharacterized protein n=1 Tax=Archangium gephyra TaxID=48 RepID=A0AAC8TIF0_9BACT|nr:Hypothetical protein AA314_08361 [Archangium gephyra]
MNQVASCARRWAVRGACQGICHRSGSHRKKKCVLPGRAGTPATRPDPELRGSGRPDSPSVDRLPGRVARGRGEGGAASPITRRSGEDSGRKREHPGPAPGLGPGRFFHAQ